MVATLKHEWTETRDHVIIEVNVRGIPRKELAQGTEITSHFVKINAKTKGIIIDLKEEVDSENVGVELDGSKNILKVTLKKKASQMWESLEMNKSNLSKEELMERRQQSTETKYKEQNKKSEELRKKKKMEEKKLFEKQWEMEKKRRQAIEDQKVEEKEKFRQEIQQLDQEKENEKPMVPTHKKKKNWKRMFGTLYEDAPEVRKVAKTVKLSFTPRVLRTAARQDKDAEMLQKFELYQKQNNAALEENPLWIKQQGDKFYKRGDYRAAIHAYTSALEKNPEFLLCVANRAAAHLQLGEYTKVKRDCDLFLNKPLPKEAGQQPSEKLIRATVATLTRRGTAAYYCGDYQQALKDYKTAVDFQTQLSDRDTGLANDYDTLKSTFDLEAAQQEQENPIAAMKQRGDDFFRYGDYQAAIRHYNQVISRSPTLPFKALANRAAAYLKIGKFADALEDANAVIDQIHQSNVDEKTNLVMKCYLRRGAAYAYMGSFKEAYADYTRASRLMPEEDSILKDLEFINARLQSQLRVSWLKNRGNYFFKAGDYESAYRTYSSAIEADDTEPVFFSNRAQCCMHMNRFVDAISDINRAFTARVPDDYMKTFQENLQARIREKGDKNVPEIDRIPTNPKLTNNLQFKLYNTRASAYIQLSEYIPAMKDYKLALQMRPNSTIIKKAIQSFQESYDRAMQERKEPSKKAIEIKDEHGNVEGEVIPGSLIQQD